MVLLISQNLCRSQWIKVLKVDHHLALGLVELASFIRLFREVDIRIEHLVLGIRIMMIGQVRIGNHHGPRQGPPETPGHHHIIRLKEHFSRRPSKLRIPLNQLSEGPELFLSVFFVLQDLRDE